MSTLKKKTQAAPLKTTKSRKRAKEKSLESATFINFLGDTISFPEGDEVLKYLREGWYEFTEQAFLVDYMRPGDTIIDCGAHAGLYSVLASNIVGDAGSVIAVDPNTDILPYLVQNLKSSAVKKLLVSHRKRRCLILQAAIGATVGEATLYRGAKSRSAYASVHSASGIGRPLKVAMLTLNHLQEKLQPQNVTLLKLDLEGNEVAALQGAGDLFAAHPDMVAIVEFTRDNQLEAGHSLEELSGIIEQNGLTIADYDAKSSKLLPVDPDEGNWYKNYFIVRDIARANKRLARTRTDIKMRTMDFVEKCSARNSVYQRSMFVQKFSERLSSSVVALADIELAITADENQRDRMLSSLPSSTHEGLPEEGAQSVIEFFENELGRIRGSSLALTESIALERQENLRTKQNLKDLKEKQVNHVFLDDELQASKDKVHLLDQQLGNAREYANSLNERLLSAKTKAVKSEVLEMELQLLNEELDAQRQLWTQKNDIKLKRDEAHAQLLSELEGRNTVLIAVENELRATKKELLDINEEIGRSKQETEHLHEASQATIAHLESRIEELNDHLAAEADLSSSKDAQIEEYVLQGEGFRVEISEFEKRIDGLASELSDQTNNFHEAMEAKKELLGINEEIVRSKQKIEHLHEASQATIAHLDSRIEELNDHLAAEADISSSKDVKIEEYVLQNEGFRVEISEFEKRIDGLASELSDQTSNFHEAMEVSRQAQDEMIAQLQGEHTARVNQYERGKVQVLDFVSGSARSLYVQLGDLENARLKLQQLIATTESLKRSRWLKLGQMLNVRVNSTLKDISDEEQAIKASMNTIALQLRYESEMHTEMSAKLNNDASFAANGQGDEAGAQTDRAHNYETFLKEDIANIGQHAFAIQRSRWYKLGKFLGLKNAKEVDSICRVYTASRQKDH